MIHLLTINLSQDHKQTVNSIFEKEGIETDHLHLQKEEITQSIIDNTFWDLIILSENPKEKLELLTTVARQFPNLPIIFLTEKDSETFYKQVLEQGATDCLTPITLYRIIPIINKGLTGNYNQHLDSPFWQGEIIDQVTNEIFLFDLQNLKCCYANKTGKRKVGYSDAELKNLIPSDLYSEYSANDFADLITPIIHDQREDIFICTYIRQKLGRDYPAEIHLKKSSIKGKTFLLAIHNDISSYWHNVLKLKRHRKTAEMFIQKNKQKEELLANASHDMRTSLESIILSNKLLFDKRNDFPKGYEKYQKAIHFSGKHLLNYINEFFDPNGDAPDLSSDFMSIESFSKKLYLVFHPIAKRNDIAFYFDTSSLQHDSITTNQTYVKRILKNLLANAFKFTNDGSVTFEVYSVSKMELQRSEITFDNAIAFKVEDTGIGIPSDQQEKIFERHQRTTHHNKGSGLGLHISKKLTNIIGGELKIDSTIGVGSTFILYLPINPESTAKPTSNEHAVVNPKNEEKHNKSILIIDDSEVHNLALREYFNYTFEECLVASTHQDAYKILGEHHIDCIVTDYLLKEGNCLEFLKTIQQDETYASTPTIVYTGKKLTDQEYTAITSLADSLVKKNAGSYERLVNTIVACLADMQA